MKIKWTNKFSGEVGFVKDINTKKKYFENTFDESEAKVFSTKTLAKTMEQLAAFCEQNTYEAISV